MDEVKRLFRPEFLNRIDETIVFHSLGQEELLQITDLLCKELEKRALAQLDIRLKISEKVKEHIVKKGTDVKSGARPLRRAVQNELEDRLAESILNGDISRGDTVEVRVKNDEITFRRKE